MKYTPTMMDELNEQKVREVLPSSLYRISYWFVYGMILLLGLGGIASANPLIMCIFLVIFIYAWKWHSKHKAEYDPDVMTEDAFKEYYFYAKQREIDYYSVCPLRQYAACVDLTWNAVQPPRCQSIPLGGDVWTIDTVHPGLMLPENYTKVCPEGWYDYTEYFVELAYRFMVVCHRLELGDAKICKFYETVAHCLWGIGDSPYKVNDLPKSPHIPFIKYPINPQQQFEICHFDYRNTSEPSGWTWEVWSQAMLRFDEDLKQHPTTPPYSKSLCLDKYNSLARQELFWQGDSNDSRFIVEKMQMRKEFDKIKLKVSF